jgi:hypothetical protein
MLLAPAEPVDYLLHFDVPSLLHLDISCSTDGLHAQRELVRLLI